MKNTERFSNRVDNYVRYRPHYPAAVIPYLEEITGSLHQTVVADIGAGTGISAEPFLDNGNRVFAVEPNKEMREMSVKLLQRYPNFVAVTGTAERTTLPDAAVDLIVSGTAFHWFDQQAARKEFQRIARKDAYVVLMWNIRQSELPFEKAYENLLRRFGTDYKDMQHRNVDALKLAAFFMPGTYKEKAFSNAQILDFPALKGRLLSSSYAPTEDHPAYNAMIKALEDLFEKYQENGLVKFHYTTMVYTGKI